MLIGTTMLSGGSVTIGTNGISTNINGTTTISGILIANTHQGSNATSGMTIGSNLSGGSLTIGTDYSTTSLNGVTTFKSQPIITPFLSLSDNSSSIFKFT